MRKPRSKAEEEIGVVLALLDMFRPGQIIEMRGTGKPGR